MTIAISLKVNDGVVLAADSASTLMEQDEQGQPTGVVNVYDNANKVFNLRKGTPVGAITWGAGSIGTASISTLAKDLRRRFTGQESDYGDWEINPNSYEVRQVADRTREFMYDEHYLPATADWPEGKEKPALGFIVAGYSTGKSLAEEYVFMLQDEPTDTEPLRPIDESGGMSWRGQPEAISRLVLGFSPLLGEVLHERLGVPSNEVGPAIDVIREALAAPLVHPAMPFQDAIDLAEFLVEMTIKVSRFAPGPPSVGGPIEVAAISKHEGFKWIRRKHYFTADLNPGIDRVSHTGPT